MTNGITTSIFHLAMCHMVPRPVNFTWQCVMQYHNQYNLAICHAKPQPVCFTWQCIIQYHHSTFPGEIHWLWYHMTHWLVALVVVPQNTLSGEIHWLWYRMTQYGITTSVFHLAMYHTLPRPVPLTWQCVIRTTTSATWQCAIRYHDQCNMTMRHTVSHPVYFTWQYRFQQYFSYIVAEFVCYDFIPSCNWFKLTEKM
jgi:hypothetical protein